MLWLCARFLVSVSSLFLMETLATHREDSLNFIVMGDWGGIDTTPFTTVIERSNAKAMARLAEERNSEFVVALGDNFYYYGVDNVDDARFDETYRHVFDQPALHVPWYVIAGNHDHRANVTAQIAYTNVSEVWTFPNFYHAHTWTVPGGKKLKLILLDTILLCGNTGADEEHLQPKGPVSMSQASEQWAWLQSELRASHDIDYLLVGGHYPVWSVAEHGPTHQLVEQLLPLLEEFNVTAYMCGHDHNLQHLHEEGNAVNYFVSGAANFMEHSRVHRHSVPHDSLKFMFDDETSDGGFASISVTNTSLTLDFVSAADEKVLYSTALKPRHLHGPE